jgi:SAM-dependent methyltransferase
MPLDVDALKERTRAAWSRGEYGGLSALLRPAARELADACAISAGQEVLDVAAGDGNLAVVAAEEGAAVAALDISPLLVERGRARTEAEGLDVEWVEGDAEALPFEDSRFDCAASVFGVMFAPRPDVVARELFRVVRPGNTVGVASWTPESLPAGIFDLNSAYLPPPEGLPRSVDWGVEDIVRERFEGLAGTLQIESRTLRWELDSEDELLGVFTATGAHEAFAEAIGTDAHTAWKHDLLELVRESNQASGGAVVLDAEYLIAVAHKRG